MVKLILNALNRSQGAIDPERCGTFKENSQILWELCSQIGEHELSLTYSGDLHERGFWRGFELGLLSCRQTVKTGNSREFLSPGIFLTA